MWERVFSSLGRPFSSPIHFPPEKKWGVPRKSQSNNFVMVQTKFQHHSCKHFLPRKHEYQGHRIQLWNSFWMDSFRLWIPGCRDKKKQCKYLHAWNASKKIINAWNYFARAGRKCQPLLYSRWNWYEIHFSLPVNARDSRAARRNKRYSKVVALRTAVVANHAGVIQITRSHPSKGVRTVIVESPESVVAGTKLLHSERRCVSKAIA